MIISKIELNNFRIYYGHNVIDLTPENGKNIIVISGQNGFGKTTFLMSLVWCLYGRQMSEVDEMYKQELNGKNDYGTWISNSLNKQAKDLGKSKLSVAITFADLSDVQAKEIKIERSFDVNTGKENLEVFFDGMVNVEWELLGDKEATNTKEFFIRENILALEAAKFFFFDAERIVAFANTNKTEQSSLLGKSFEQVLGIKRYLDLKEQLSKIQDDYKKEVDSSLGKADYRQILTDIEAIEDDIKFCSEDIAQNKDNRDDYKKESERLQNKIIREGDVISDEELEELRKNEGELLLEMSENNKGLSEILNVLPFGICGGLLSDVIHQSELEQDYKQYQLQSESIDERTYNLLNDLDQNYHYSGMYIDIRIREFYQEQLKSLIKKYFTGDNNSEDFENFELLHDLSDSQTKELYQLVSKVKSSRSTFLNAYHKYNVLKSDLAGIRRKITEAEQKGDSTLVLKLRKEKGEVDQNYEKSIEAIVKGQAKLKQLGDDKKTLLQKKESIGKQIHISETNAKYNDEISKMIRILEKFTKEFKERRIQSLEERISEKFKSLLHKKELVGKVDVTMLQNDEIEITVRDTKNRKIDQLDLSMGERQMLSSSILASLVDETNTVFPVFIDSPLQKFDTDHTESILKKFYPYVSKQVIIFPLLRKELREEEYEMIKPRVAKAFVIKNETKGSHFKEIVTSELFNYK